MKTNKINLTNDKWENNYEGNIKSYVVSDDGNYKKLMLVGNDSGGGWAHIYTDRPNFAFNKQLTDVSANPKDYMKFNEGIRIAHNRRVDGGEGHTNNQWLTVHGGHKVGPWGDRGVRAIFWAERE